MGYRILDLCQKGQVKIFIKFLKSCTGQILSLLHKNFYLGLDRQLFVISNVGNHKIWQHAKFQSNQLTFEGVRAKKNR